MPSGTLTTRPAIKVPSVGFCRGSSVEGKMSRVEDENVEGKMSRVQKSWGFYLKTLKPSWRLIAVFALIESC